MARSNIAPVTAKNRALTKKHLKESIKFNEDHAKEHAKQAKEDQKLLEKRSKDRKKGY